MNEQKSIIWAPDPSEVEMRLRNASFEYPRNIRNVNYGYSHVAVIPVLYQYVTASGNVPDVATVANYLYQSVDKSDPRRKVEGIDRTKKLVLDFYRELHTFGLLAKSSAFGLVSYAKATDIDLGVDYVARLSRLVTYWVNRSPDEVGIQSKIGGANAYSRNGYYQVIKEQRKIRRNAGAWEGPIYWLTNEHRPAVLVKESRVLLFSWQHIADLVEEITGTGISAIQTRMVAE